MKTKRCCRCKIEKPLLEFHNNRKYPDGKAVRCAECTGVVVKAWRESRKHTVDYILKERKRHREYSDKNRDKVREATRKKIARQRREGKVPVWRYSPKAHRARRALQRAIKRGRIKRPDHCQSCGTSGSIQAHHHDYSKPYDVEWLCSLCHGKKHRLPDKVMTRPTKVLRPKPTLLCQVCGHRWTPKNIRRLPAMCRECGSIHWRTGKPERIRKCRGCGKEFKRVAVHSRRVFCSPSCCWKFAYSKRKARRREARREVRESIQKCGKCLQIVERLG